MKLRQILASAIAVSAIAISSSASAGYLNFKDLTALDNQNSGTIGGTYYAAGLNGGTANATFGFKTLGGARGLGVRGGDSGNEIDYGVDGGENIFIEFGSGTGLSSLTLGAIFNGPEHGDVDEIAQIVATLADGSTLTGTLFMQGDGAANDGIWVLEGADSDVAAQCSGMTGSGPGLCSISDPFGSATIVDLRFTALDDRNGGFGNNSDYTLVSMTVPEPATLGLLGLGLFGLGAAIRRRRSA